MARPERDISETFSTRWLVGEWSFLAYLNYRTSPDRLTPHLPYGTELDLFEGAAFVSLVGWVESNVRWLGIPVPGARHAPRIEARMYVKRQEADGWRRGWVSLAAEGYAARQELRFDERDDEPGGRISAEYGWERAGRAGLLRVVTTGFSRSVESSSWEKFLTDRDYLYREGRGGSREVRLEHRPPWFYRDAAEFVVDGETEHFAPYFTGDPESAFLVEGGPVALGRARAIRWG